MGNCGQHAPIRYLDLYVGRVSGLRLTVRRGREILNDVIVSDNQIGCDGETGAVRRTADQYSDGRLLYKLYTFSHAVTRVRCNLGVVNTEQAAQDESHTCRA